MGKKRPTKKINRPGRRRGPWVATLDSEPLIGTFEGMITRGSSARSPQPSQLVDMGKEAAKYAVAPEFLYDKNGAQRSTMHRADLLPSLALLEISKLLKKGAEDHGDTDPLNPKWLGTPVSAHVNRAMVHLLSFLAGDTQEEHLLHASCRLLFALHSDLRRKLRAK